MTLVRPVDLYLASVIAVATGTGWLGSRAAKETIAALLGSAAYRGSRRKRRLSEDAVARALGPGVGLADRRRIVRGALREFWREALSLVPTRRERAVLDGVEVQGLERLREPSRAGRGAILWESALFGRRLLAKRILREHGFAVYQVHAENHIGGFTNPDDGSVVRRRLIRPFFQRSQRRSVADVVELPLSDSLAFARILLRHLRDGHIVCSASDGTMGQNFVEVPVLGGTARFATGVITLARASGAPLLPMFCFAPRPGHTTLVIEPAIPIATKDTRDQTLQDAIAEYARLLESYVMRYPTQYRGWHMLDRASAP